MGRLCGAPETPDDEAHGRVVEETTERAVDVVVAVVDCAPEPALVPAEPGIDISVDWFVERAVVPPVVLATPV